MNKYDILDNVEQYEATDLYVFICKGQVSFEELISESNGALTPDKRREIKRLIDENVDLAWDQVLSSPSVEACQRYLDENIKGKHRDEARQLKQELLHEQETQERLEEKALEEKAFELEQNEQIQNEIDSWNAVNKSDMGDIDIFIARFPQSEYVKEALKLKNALSAAARKRMDEPRFIKRIKSIANNDRLGYNDRLLKYMDLVRQFVADNSYEEFILFFSNHLNLFDTYMLKQMMDEGLVDSDSLISVGVPEDVFDKMEEEKEYFDSYNDPLYEVQNQSTEVYFWGIPSSGKSCVLAAIINVANNSDQWGVFEALDCQGYGYMDDLRNIFEADESSYLPESTALTAFYEMAFELTDNVGNKHPITCIDMAGELMACMHKDKAQKELSEEAHNMLQTMRNVLMNPSNSNRKIHVFVVEYNDYVRKYDGKNQDTYLTGAVDYLKDIGIFQKDTDAIFLMVTKWDKSPDQSVDAMKEYLKKRYNGLLKHLRAICKDCEINNGELELLPFSLGKVYFQNICIFDAKPAENMVRILLERSAVSKNKKSLFNKFASAFKQ